MSEKPKKMENLRVPVKKKRMPGRGRIIVTNLVLALIALVICIVVGLICITPQTYDIVEGEVAPQTITAPHTVIDEISTQRMIEEEQAKVLPSYKRDADVSQQILKKVSEDFSSFQAAHDYAEEVYQGAEQQKVEESADEVAAAQSAAEESAANATPSPTPAPGETAAPTPAPEALPTQYVAQAFHPESAEWQSLLSEEDWEALRDMLPEYMEDEDILALLSLTNTQLSDLKNIAESQIQSMVYAGIESDDVDETKRALVSGITSQFDFSDAQNSVVEKLIGNDIEYNMIFDADATQAEKNEVAKMVTPVEYKTGQNIVVKGDIVKAEPYAVLKNLGMLSSESTSTMPYLAVTVYIVLLFIMYAVFLALFNQRLLMDTKKVAILAILTAAAYGVTAIAQLVAVHIYPVFLFVILGAVLLSPKNAIVYSVFLSALLMSVTSGTASGEQRELLSVDSLTMLLTMLIGSFFAIFAIKDMRYRSRLAVAGVLAAVPGLVIEFMAWAFKMINTEQLLNIYGMILLSGFLCGIAAIGVIPLIENAFKLITPTKLLELSGPDHPLLKRLMFEAPGTYHHSMLVANLAEAACDSVGGFSLLARVGGYFHDVGKLENPQYFKENQMGNHNPLDELTPAEATKIIKKHVPDGLALLKKCNMPKEIQAILVQHHGTSLVRFFYAKAAAENPDVNAEEFRYKGILPNTKEAAIIMLSDIVEAAVRSMDSPSREEIAAQVSKLVKMCYDEGQLDNAPLNRQELNSIQEAFINIFDGVYSTRIKYPEIKFHGVEDGDNVL